MAKRNLDEKQQEAVRSNENAVVSAGAGSGKTTVLAERYLRIVEQGLADIEQILTLTYTRKAAAEMYERIYGRLLEESDNPAIREQVSRFDRAQIATLDSFCVQVLRNDPAHFGIRSDFRLGEDETTRMDEETALRFLLDNSDDPALLEFIQLNGFEGVWKDFFVSLSASYLHLASNHDFEALFVRQIGALAEIVAELSDEMLQGCREVQALDPGAAKAIGEAQAAIASLPELRELIEGGSFAELADVLDGFALSRRLGRAKSLDVESYRELSEAILSARDRVRTACRTLASQDTLKRLFQLCGEYQQLLLTRRRSSGALSFQDVVEMAVRLLRENSALRRYYKQRFRFIMIDEFQDNNELQKELLYLLAERVGEEADGQPGAERLAPDKLFFVGDEKQSIYRFRGADVSVFRNLSTELDGSEERAISLATNYRSAPALIDFFNAFFSRTFADPTEDFEARFEGLRAGLRHGDSAEEGHVTPEASVRVFYKPYEEHADQDEAHSDDAEAHYIARFIQQSVVDGSLAVRSRGELRPARWEDFAVLMRTTSNQIRYERIFRRLGIPYSTQSIRTLFLEAPLNDIYSALQLTVYPDDRSAYAALLRSPLVNLSDEAMVELLLEGGAPFSELPAELADRVDAERWEAGREMLLRLQGMADVRPIARLIDEVWYRCGYRYTLLKDASYHPYLEYYDYFRKLAQNADDDGRSLAEFLDLIRPNLGKYEKLPELEVVRDQSGGVQLLTIHKSKGLEFPVVILANSGNLGRSRGEGSQPYFLSDEFGPTLRITDENNYFYEMAKEENQRKERAELKRLLYVAMTRAESHLIVSGCHNRQNRSSEDVLLNMVLRVVAPQALQTEEGSSPEPTPAPEFAGVRFETIPSVTEEQLLRRSGPTRRSDSRETAAGYAAAETVGWQAKRTSFSATEASAFLWNCLQEPTAEAGLFPAGLTPPEILPAISVDALLEERDLEASFGTLAHAVVELMVSGVEEPAEGDLSRRVLRSIDRAVLEQLIADARLLAAGFLSSPLGLRARAAQSRWIERSFLYRPDGEHEVRGSFDLLFEDGEGACVVDFKTDRELQPEVHAAQLHAYRLAAAELLGHEVKSYLYYMRDGRVIEIDDGLLQPLYARFLGSRGNVEQKTEWTDEGVSALTTLLMETGDATDRDIAEDDAPADRES